MDKDKLTNDMFERLSSVFYNVAAEHNDVVLEESAQALIAFAFEKFLSLEMDTTYLYEILKETLEYAYKLKKGEKREKS